MPEIFKNAIIAGHIAIIAGHIEFACEENSGGGGYHIIIVMSSFSESPVFLKD